MSVLHCGILYIRDYHRLPQQDPEWLRLIAFCLDLNLNASVQSECIRVWVLVYYLTLHQHGGSVDNDSSTIY